MALEGTQIGHYRLQCLIGSGGMGDLPSPAEIRTILANPPPGVRVHYLGNINEPDYIAGKALVCNIEQVQ